jgi:hypothetical protein
MNDQGNSAGPIRADVQQVVAEVQSRLRAKEELIVRPLDIQGPDGSVEPGSDGWPAVVLYLNTLVASEVIDRFVLQPLLTARLPRDTGMESAMRNLLPVSRLERTTSLDIAIQGLLDGEALLLVHGVVAMFRISAQQSKPRSPEEPDAERIVRGSKEGFIEYLDVNLALIRRRLRTEDLRISRLRIGRRSATPVAICFLEGVARPGLVSMVMERLRAIDIDVVEQSSVIESYIKDFRWSPFPQVRISERPDTIVRELANGRVGILVDGTPTALLAPATFWDLLATESDYSYSSWVGSLFRFVRLVSVVIGATFPGLYIAAVSFHPELIPNRLSLSITGSREGMPFPTAVEMAIMLLIFEIFREATLRMPKSLGQTAGVVAGFILGQAAVAAGIISDVMVVVIALSAISLFVIPDFGLKMVMRLISIGSLLAAASFGLFGLALWGILVVTHLATLTSFGVPFLSPIAPARKGWWRDTILRAPPWLKPQGPRR